MARKIPLDETGCPIQLPFRRWWRGQIGRNMEAQHQAGRPVRLGFFVTESQVARRLGLRPTGPGEVAEHLEGCGMNLVVKEGDEEGKLLGWKGLK